MQDITRAIGFLISYADEALAIVGGIVLAASVLVKAFIKLIAFLQRFSKYTVTTVDDDLLLHAANFTAKLSDWLGAVIKVIRPVSVRGSFSPSEPNVIRPVSVPPPSPVESKEETI